MNWNIAGVVLLYLIDSNVLIDANRDYYPTPDSKIPQYEVTVLDA